MSILLEVMEGMDQQGVSMSRDVWPLKIGRQKHTFILIIKLNTDLQ